MTISKDVKYVGVNDASTRLFEGQYHTPNGMSYNSYIITDEKTAVLDSVEASFGEEWIKNIECALDGKAPDYLIVQHMEPDHSANIDLFANKYPSAIVVSSKKSFAMMKNFFGTDYPERHLEVSEGSTLSLGKHELTFITAPMVHWPEVMLTYDKTDRILFSADAFGKFGVQNADEEWDGEAQRYYMGIVGKYGAQVQSLLKKAAGLDISVIAPLHGPVLNKDLGHYIGLYNSWSSYTPVKRGAALVYSSVYGNTAKAVKRLGELLSEGGIECAVYDLSHDDMAGAVGDAFKYSNLVLASVTYNAEIFPHMRSFITALLERGYRSRTVSLIENGSWAPMAAKVMRGMLEGAKDIRFSENTVRINSAPDLGTEDMLKALANELTAEINS